MVSIDLKDAYYHVPIHVDHQKYLRVAIYMGSRVAHFQYQALPFGVTVAPRVFTKVIAEMAAHIREEPGVFIPYLDDFLLIGDTFQDVKRQLDRTLKILSRLGWQINWEKSSLVPSQTKQFLGIIIDSKKERFFSSPEENRGHRKSNRTPTLGAQDFSKEGNVPPGTPYSNIPGSYVGTGKLPTVAASDLAVLGQTERQSGQGFLLIPQARRPL